MKILKPPSQFGPPDFPPFPRLQRPQLDRPKRDPHQLRYRMPERFEHVPNLSILAFDEFDDEVCFAC